MPAAAAPQAPHPLKGADARLGSPDDWVDRFGDSLLRFAATRVGDLSLAEDLVQETLLAAWKGRHRFDAQCEPKTWMVSILKRKVADHWRRTGRNRFEARSLESEGEAAGCEVEKAEFWTIVRRCTSDLPDHLARAFRLRTFGDVAPESICDSEGISRKNLSVRLHRARLLLRECLENRWFTARDKNSSGP